LAEDTRWAAHSLHQTPLNTLDSTAFVLESNCNCDFTQRDRDSLRKHWYNKTFYAGVIYATVYCKRGNGCEPDSTWQARKIGLIESSIQKLKSVKQAK
jgi:hypothetical protein